VRRGRPSVERALGERERTFGRRQQSGTVRGDCRELRERERVLRVGGEVSARHVAESGQDGAPHPLDPGASRPGLGTLELAREKERAGVKRNVLPSATRRPPGGDAIGDPGRRPEELGARGGVEPECREQRREEERDHRSTTHPERSVASGGRLTPPAAGNGSVVQRRCDRDFLAGLRPFSLPRSVYADKERCDRALEETRDGDRPVPASRTEAR
jgi:hypothetical protein